ncbi:MAG: VCBS repeat-containing protein [Polyangiaceae bacterium]|nr:VCBS repeat-containing protein [Polyangiaceae bacterium]
MAGRALGVLLFLGALGLAARARAEDESGVSPSRLSLPAGPGSLEGVGEDAEPNLSMGFVNYHMPFVLPASHATLPVELGLAYSSAGGASVVGMGWSLGVPAIERHTARGLPRYDASDSFSADGTELVALPGSTYYRARREEGFVRYTWHNPDGDGRGGYFEAEHPDGTQSFYGAGADGTLVDSARIAGTDGVFRYHLVERTDALGHRVRYEYEKDSAAAYLTAIRWVFTGDAARYEVLLDYEAREDELVDGKPGFEVRLTRRLANVTVRVRGELLRRYALRYEPYEDSGGFTRLAGVRTYGTDDETAYPIEFGFAYTGSFDPVCQPGSNCSLPALYDLGSVGVDFRSGAADLVDLNGDGLPDVLDSTEGRHLIHLNLMTGADHGFTGPSPSDLAGSGAMALSSPQVKLVDLDGDGYSDLVDGLGGRVLWNRGAGDWAAAEDQTTGLPDFAADAELRFFDYDHDGKIDAIHSDGESTFYYLNQGDGTFSATAELGEPLGWGFARDGLRMADMNGDGMQDAVLAAAGSLTYRPYLGRGRFGEPTDMFGLSPDLLPAELDLVDVNGDSLADAVVVLGNEVRFALNRNGRDFDELTVLREVSGGSIPERTDAESVRFADMNGSGSTDIAWIDASGRVTYLELVPRRPNLLSRVTNGIGKVLELFYETTVEAMAKDGGAEAWPGRLPNPMLTLSRLETYDTLSGIRQIQTFHYANGYWDGAEREFGGFVDVEILLEGDGSLEPGRQSHVFDVGRDDTYRRGRLLQQTTESAGRVLSVAENAYDNCPLADVPDDTTPPVRFVCQTGVRRTVQEGRPEDKWLTIDEEYAYDGYGNRTRTAKLGVTTLGGGACPPCDRDAATQGEPCGAACLGDERFEETSFVPPSSAAGRWLLRAPYRTRVRGEEGSELFTEELTYYDGEAFEGLQLGEIELGLRRRMAMRLDAAGTLIDKERFDHDAHGNIVAAEDANGHERRFEYDTDGILATAEEVVLDDPGHDAGLLRMEVTYGSPIEKSVRSTAWFVGVDGAESAPVTRYGYDVFGRLVAIAKPSDTLTEPTQSYAYELADPVSRFVARGRSRSGEAPDLVTVQCFDGMGRKVQERVRVRDDLYQADGFTVFNVQGGTRRQHQPYTADSGACDREPPADVPFTEAFFDVQGRVLSLTLPDAPTYGTASVRFTEYGPGSQTDWDEEDSDAESPHSDTPMLKVTDGLGRLVRVEERSGSDAAPLVSEFLYDGLGRLQGYRDAAGNEKRQSRDLLGRVVRIEDPDTGTARLGYDPVGNLLRRTDARGETRRFEYDEANRRVAEWADSDPDGTRVERFYDQLPDDAECGANECSHLAGRLAMLRYPLLDGDMGEDRFGYDARGSVTFTSRRLADMRFDTHFTLDNADRLVATEYPDSRTIGRDLDGQGRLTRVAGYVDSVAYTEQGLVAAIALASGTQSRYDYDVLQRLAALTITDPDDEELVALRFSRDRTGGPLAVLDDATRSGEPSFAARYDYDALYRLTSAALDPEADDLAETLTYAYDDIDNLTRKVSDLGAQSPAHVGNYEYDPESGPHLAIRAGEDEYEFDAAGHLLGAGSQSYEWDAAGRLVRVVEDEDEVARFAYAATGERVVKAEGASRTYYVSPAFEVRDGIATTYIDAGRGRGVKLESASFAAGLLPDLAPAKGDDDALTPEPDERITAGDAWLAYAHQAGMLTVDGADEDIDPDVVLASANRSLIIGEGELVTYLHQDQIGSTILSTDESGRALQRSAYYPYGEERFASRYLEEHGFSGQERDRTTGLSYHAARYYDPRLGRWTAADPLFSELADDALERSREALSRYAYARSAPTTWVDPTGTAADEAAAGGEQPTYSLYGGQDPGLSDADILGDYVEVIAKLETRGLGDTARTETLRAEASALAARGPRAGTSGEDFIRFHSIAQLGAPLLVVDEEAAQGSLAAAISMAEEVGLKTALDVEVEFSGYKPAFAVSFAMKELGVYPGLTATLDTILEGVTGANQKVHEAQDRAVQQWNDERCASEAPEASP